MAKVALVTDSTAYLPTDLVDKFGIRVAPQVLIWGENTYLDGVDIQPDEFYRRLSTAKTLPTTSQVSVKSFAEIFGSLIEEGYDILAVLISSELSGTISSANQARAMFPDANIEIVDSRTTAMAMGFVVLTAARAAAEGASLDECKALAEQAREKVGVVFAVDTLEFLHRGGRIGGATRFLGTALNIKPILEVRGGRVEPLERVRTKRKAHKRLVELIGERTGSCRSLRMAAIHANASEEAHQLLDIAAEKYHAQETLFSQVSPVVGTHTGPGTVGLAYLMDL